MTNIKPYEKLNTEYKKIILTRKRINKSLKFNIDKEKAYEWLFLYSITLFENYLETLFIWILKWKFKVKRWVWIKLDNDINFSINISDKKIKKFILWDKWWSYLNWLPYVDHTKKRAKKYFIDWKPFTDIDDSYNSTFNEIKAIRNYIAHKSIESKKILKWYYPSYWHTLFSLLNKQHSNWNVYLDYFIIELNSISWLLQKNILNKK